MDKSGERGGEGNGPEARLTAAVEPSRPRGSVLGQSAMPSERMSPLRWLIVVVPLVVLVLAAAYLVRSILGRVQSPTVSSPGSVSMLPPVARPEPGRERSTADGPKFPWFPYGATNAPEQAPPSLPPSQSAEPWQFDAAVVTSRIAGADLRNGRALFKICSFCHTGEPAGGHRLGPALWNMMGRDKASYPDYAYSQALKAQRGRWTYEEMARYLYDTRSAVPGGKMSFAGIKDPAKLADVIAFMRTLADKPIPPPKTL